MKWRLNPCRFRVKPFGFRSPPIGCALIVLAVTTATHGSLTPNILVDTPTQLVILWDWDEFNPPPGPVFPETNVVPGLVNWFARVDVDLAVGLPPPIGTWTVDILVRHLTDPHLGDGPGGGNIAMLSMSFDDTMFLGLPVPPQPGSTATVLHPGIGHTDEYEMQIFHSVGGNANVIKLLGTHVPSAPTLSLLVLSAFAGGRRRR